VQTNPVSGVSVPAVNVPGATGGTGMAKLVAGPADGYSMAVYIADTHALLATTAAYPGFPERIELIGTKASAVLAAGVLTIHHHDGREERTGEEQGTGGGADPMAFPHDAHRALLNDFLDALDQGREPSPSGREALEVHRFVDAVLRASAEGRTVKLAAG